VLAFAGGRKGAGRSGRSVGERGGWSGSMS
jgi:hypothetical protein